MVVLSNADLEALAQQLGVTVKYVQTGLVDRTAMYQLYHIIYALYSYTTQIYLTTLSNIAQLKNIIKYLRTDKGARVNLTGTKNVLVDGICRALWEDGNPTKVYPMPQQRPVTTHLPQQPQAGHVTIEHNTSWQPQQWVPPKPHHLTFNDENFFAKQVPFFEHVALLAVMPFNAREDMHPKSSFQIDEATLTAVKEKKRLVHARFFSKERRGDIPWNIDVVLKINGSLIDIQRLARKIRSKAYKEPYILPRPADVSHTLRTANTVEFCHPGETGYLVLHLVQERNTDTLISHVVNNCKVTAASRQQMKNDDIEEMNYVLSMKCPLSCMRIENPVRSKLCNHEQCFDLRSFIDYCYQQQLWHCPVCEIGAPYKDLVYDDNFKAISTTTSADKVTVSPDGTITDADGEPTAKRPRLNTPPSAGSPPPPSAPPSARSIITPPSAPNGNPPPPPTVIALVDDSPPPSPVPRIIRPLSSPVPFVFAPPPQVQIPSLPTTTTTTTTTTTSTSSADVPMLDNPPPPPSALPIPAQSAFPSEPPNVTNANSNAVLPTSQSSSPSPAQTQPTPTTPPSSQQINSTSPSHNSSQPQVIDLKQEPGLIKKILQKLPSWSPSSTPTSTTAPTNPLPPPSPTTTTPPSTSPLPSTPNQSTTTTTTTTTQQNGKAQQNGHGHGSAYEGNTSTDAIVISDDDD